MGNKSSQNAVTPRNRDYLRCPAGPAWYQAKKQRRSLSCVRTALWIQMTTSGTNPMWSSHPAYLSASQKTANLWSKDLPVVHHCVVTLPRLSSPFFQSINIQSPHFVSNWLTHNSDQEKPFPGMIKPVPCEATLKWKEELKHHPARLDKNDTDSSRLREAGVSDGRAAEDSTKLSWWKGSAAETVSTAPRKTSSRCGHLSEKSKRKKKKGRNEEPRMRCS